MTSSSSCTPTVRHRDPFVDGDWRPGPDRVPVLDPSDGSVIAEVTVSGVDDCVDAVAAADRAFASYAATSSRERSDLLRRAFDLMTAESEDLARLVAWENGKVLTDARAEIGYAAEFLRWFSEEAVRVSGDFRPAPAGDKTIIVTHQPVGVSVLVTPWNFPAAMMTRKIGPALAAGCTVVAKPALETPLTALAIADVLGRAGAPPGVVNVVTPADPAAAVSRMLGDPRVRNLSFTGSTATGRLLLRQAADRVLRTSMELGGNAPFLVLDDADVTAAVEGAMIAKLRNGGAACTAANRFYVARAVAADFCAQLTEAMGAVRMAPGLDDGAQLGASVSVAERDKVSGWVDEAVDHGAEVLTGGRVPSGRGAFYPPTVLLVDATNPILDHEVFGPVAPVVVVDSDDEAVTAANDCESGLISYVWSGDVGRGLAVARRLQAGMVAVNKGVISDPAAPFGGMKQSGLGREGGFAGIHEFLESTYIGLAL